MFLPRTPTVLGWLALVASFLLGMAACSRAKKDPPKTYPVTGKAVYRDGSPVPEGSLEFFPISGTSYHPKGFIRDGTFTLKTVAENTSLDGAPEGEYRVTIILGQGQEPGPPLQYGKTVKVKTDETNEITLTLDRAKPR
jgi:hypothetical protein